MLGSVLVWLLEIAVDDMYDEWRNSMFSLSIFSTFHQYIILTSQYSFTFVYNIIRE